MRSPLLVMLLIIPCPPCLPQVMLSTGGSGGKATGHGVWVGGGGLGAGGSGGRGFRGQGQGIFHPPCHILHYHMVLRPKGTSHNHENTLCLKFVVVPTLGLPCSHGSFSCVCFPLSVPLDPWLGTLPWIPSPRSLPPEIRHRSATLDQNPAVYISPYSTLHGLRPRSRAPSLHMQCSSPLTCSRSGRSGSGTRARRSAPKPPHTSPPCSEPCTTWSIAENGFCIVVNGKIEHVHKNISCVFGVYTKLCQQ